MPYNINIREEELKNKIAKDYFGVYDTTKIIGNVDFTQILCQCILGIDRNVIANKN